MGSRITRIEYCLPETVRTNADIEKVFPDFKSAKVEQKIGIVSRHAAAPDETALDLAQKACEKLFRHYEKGKIDYLLLCTQSPDYILPTSACILQDRLGLSKSVGALDYNLGCSGFVYGLSLAKGLISGGIAEHVLLVTSETYSKHISPADKGNTAIFGDAAAATVIESSEEEHIGRFCLGTDGSGYQKLIVRNGGMRSPKDGGSGDHLFMDGPEVFKFVMEAVPEMVRNVLLKNGLSVSDIDCFVLHQANAYMLKTLRKLMNIPEDRFYVNMKETGNTVSATIPLAMKQAEEQGIIRRGDRILLAGFGVGFSYGAAVITF